MTNPRTYAQALAAAEEVTIAEGQALVAEADGCVALFPGKGQVRRLTLDIRFHSMDEIFAFIGFDFCDRNGNNAMSTASLHLRPVFDLYNQDRIIVITPPKTATNQGETK